MNADRIYLKGIAHELEEPRDIDHLEEVRRQPELLDNLKAAGVSAFCTSRKSPAEMAAASATRTLWKTKTDPKAVDLLVFATSSLWERDFYGRDIQSLITKLGLANAFPIGITLSECANLLVALSVAADAIRQGGHKNVLVVAADKTQEGRSRVVPPDVSVASDAAASVLLTSDSPGPYELLATRRYMIPLAQEGPASGNFTQYLKMTTQGIREVSARTFAAIDKRPEDFAWLITNNYNQSVARLFASETGVPLDRVYTRNIGRYGHGFGADNLINLYDCAGEHPPQPGDLFYLLASGPNMWATAVLRKT